MKTLKQFITLLTFMSFNSFCAEQPQKPFFKEPLTEYKKEDWRNAGRYNKGIRFFIDANGNHFVMKYQKNAQTAIHDTLGARIANDLKIPSNQVILLPTGSLFMGETLKHPTTIHTHAPGKAINTITMPYYINIKNGLSIPKNLDSITKNKTLGDFVAFNLVFNRNDTQPDNIFYEQKTDQFYTIDFGNIFHTVLKIPNENNDLYSPYGDNQDIRDRVYPKPTIHDNSPFWNSNMQASEAREFIQTLKNTFILSLEVDALERLNTKLQEIITKYPAEKIYDEWMKIAQEAHYEYSPQKKECIKVMLKYTLDECKQLHEEIDTLIKESRDKFIDEL